MLGNIVEQSLRALRYAYFTLSWALLSLVALMGLSASCLTIFVVNGHSMEPTLSPGEYLLVNRLAYIKNPIKHGDIVVASFGNGSNDVRLVKRVTAVAGETAQMADGKQIRLGADQLFLEGDNSLASTDSRVYGPVTRNQIIGRVLWQTGQTFL